MNKVSKRIIDKKRILLTEQEWETYQTICKSYDRPNFNGSSLFSELFETDKDGLIIFLKPPKSFVSMEVYLFVMSIFCHQHIREMYDRVNEVVEELNDKKDKADQLISLLEKCRAG